MSTDDAERAKAVRDFQRVLVQHKEMEAQVKTRVPQPPPHETTRALVRMFLRRVLRARARRPCTHSPPGVLGSQCATRRA